MSCKLDKKAGDARCEEMLNFDVDNNGTGGGDGFLAFDVDDQAGSDRGSALDLDDRNDHGRRDVEDQSQRVHCGDQSLSTPASPSADHGKSEGTEHQSAGEPIEQPETAQSLLHALQAGLHTVAESIASYKNRPPHPLTAAYTFASLLVLKDRLRSSPVPTAVMKELQAVERYLGKQGLLRTEERKLVVNTEAFKRMIGLAAEDKAQAANSAQCRKRTRDCQDAVERREDERDHADKVHVSG